MISCTDSKFIYTRKLFLNNKINSLPNNKILELSKLQIESIKFSRPQKKKVTQKLKFALGRVEKIVGKGENAGYQHFLVFQQFFQKATF